MNKKKQINYKSMLRAAIVSAVVLAFFIGIVVMYYNMLYNKERELIIKNGETSAKQTATELDEYLATSSDATLNKIQEITEEAVASGRSDVEFILDRDNTVIAYSGSNGFGKNYGERRRIMLSRVTIISKGSAFLTNALVKNLQEADFGQPSSSPRLIH